MDVLGGHSVEPLSLRDAANKLDPHYTIVTQHTDTRTRLAIPSGSHTVFTDSPPLGQKVRFFNQIVCTCEIK